MSSEENEAVVRRFWNELIVGGNVEVAPELLTPDYVNLIVERIGGDDVSTGPAGIDPTRNGVDHLMAAIKEWHEVVESASFDRRAIGAADRAVPPLLTAAGRTATDAVAPVRSDRGQAPGTANGARRSRRLGDRARNPPPPTGRWRRR